MMPTNAPRTIERKGLQRWFPLRNEHCYFFTLWLISGVVFWRPLVGLANLSLRDENSSHIPLIPLISGFLIWLQRRRIFHSARYSPAVGIPLVLAAVVLRYLISAPLLSLNPTDRLSAQTTLIVVAWIGVFIGCYGTGSFKAAVFPLLFLVLMIPLPVALANSLISVLQRGSAETCNVLFRLLGVPVLRRGMVFSLPGVNIEIAQQCSGIHSGLSLLIAGLLAAQFVLRGTWKKVCFILWILPIAIFKNAVRIVTIAWIGVHVDPAVFQSRLHRQGGLPFSLLSLALMALLLWLLRLPIAFSPVTPHPAD